MVNPGYQDLRAILKYFLDKQAVQQLSFFQGFSSRSRFRGYGSEESGTNIFSDIDALIWTNWETSQTSEYII